jgi:hypothetical protein
MKKLLAISLPLALACSSAPPKPEQKLNRFGRPVKQGIQVPGWVDKIPESGQGKMYAVGFSGPTYWPQDALNNAAENARGKLALAMTSHVEFLGMDSATARSQGGAIINKEATDVVMQNSRIEASWVDENGDRGEPGSVWTLASILTDPAARYAQKAPSAPGAVWTNGTRARAPSWLDKLPGSKSKVFAAGYSGPTFRADDAVQYAGDNAIDNLVASLRAHVQAYTLLVENASGLSVDDFARSENADDSFKDIVKKSAKIEATWVDADGVRPGDPPGAVWALASIEVQNSKGGVKAVENQDLGPALDKQGNAPAEATPATPKK